MYDTLSQLFISVFMVAYAAVPVAIVAGGPILQLHRVRHKALSLVSLLHGGEGMERLRFRLEVYRKHVH